MGRHDLLGCAEVSLPYHREAAVASEAPHLFSSLGTSPETDFTPTIASTRM